MASYNPPRKAASINTNGAKGFASAGSQSAAKYNRKAATGPVSLNRKPAGVSPSSVPVNDKDNGHGTGNAR